MSSHQGIEILPSAASSLTAPVQPFEQQPLALVVETCDDRMGSVDFKIVFGGRQVWASCFMAFMMRLMLAVMNLSASTTMPGLSTSRSEMRTEFGR